MTIRVDDLSGLDVAAFLDEHLSEMRRVSPPDSVHALDLQALRRPEITFWVLWDGDQLAGCGALKELDDTHGEIKSMRTATTHRNQGIASKILAHMIDQARNRGYQRLSLETGSMAFFEPARRLYQKFGFKPCPPFGDYKEDPNSVFFTKTL
jgi:putative acetyltransferase